MTTFEPGARLVFTHGFTCRPRSTAFLAINPAASITDGFDVLVQLVMAAMTTEPLPTPNPLAGAAPGKEVRKFSFTCGNSTRSCGRFGPAMDGTTSPRSSDRVDEYMGSGVESVRKRPC